MNETEYKQKDQDYINNFDSIQDDGSQENDLSYKITNMVETEEEMYKIYSILQRNTDINKNDLLKNLKLQDIYELFAPDYYSYF
jgi:type IV secretory pathway VirB6-like protein